MILSRVSIVATSFDASFTSQKANSFLRYLQALQGRKSVWERIGECLEGNRSVY